MRSASVLSGSTLRSNPKADPIKPSEGAFPKKGAPSPLFYLILYPIVALSRTENERDAPNACQGDDRVDHAAEQGALSPAKPRNDVKLEQADASPVQGTDYGENQRNSIHDHNLLSPFFIRKTRIFRLCLVCTEVKCLYYSLF